MIRRPLQIALLSLLCGGAALALLARAEPEAGAAQAGQTTQPLATQPATPATTPSGLPAPEAPLPKSSPPKLEELLQPVADMATAIEQAEKQLDEAPGVQKELAALRARIEKIEYQARAAAEALQPRLAEVRSQIDKLGQPPADGAPPETPEVASERDRLNTLAAQIDGAIKKAALVEERALQLITRVQQVRQGIFTRFLFWQTQTPLRLDVWRTAGDQLYLARRQIAFIGANWWSVAALEWLSLLGALAAALLAYVGLRAVTAWLMRARLESAAVPSRAERAANALLSTLAYAVPGAAAALVLYAGLDEAGLLYWQVERFAQSVLFSFLVFLGISALARAVLEPKRPHWRLLDLDDVAAGRICLAVKAIAAIYALDFLARRVISILSLPPAASIIAAFVASLLYAAIIALIVSTPFTPQGQAPGAPVERWRPYWLKALLVALAVLELGAALLGYVALARFVAGQVLMTGAGLMIVALVHLAIGGIDMGRPEATEIGQAPDGPEAARRQMMMGRGLRLALNSLLIAVAVPLILMAWGISVSEILSSLRAALLGFEVGGVRISLVRILAALFLFAAVMTGTRLFQRWLAARALPGTRLDTGVANSIYTGAGYLGFAIALLAAVAYAGFDITSLAIVAGALSVGIGFGLQGIVNNFVSGLVLLVERPIKVGDWIAIREGEGYVRRISVRATEIETFDRASLIVPNSELITQTVTNLTHRNQLGRLNINVRVSYAADPELAQEVLQKVAEANTSILRHPAPVVVLDELGEQAMLYSVRVYLSDINRSLPVQTEIRTQIVKALRAAGIDIPYFAVQIGHASGPQAAPERVTVRIAAALDADPEAVIEALFLAARRCPHVRQDPAPEVTLDNVGETALEFSLAATVAEGTDARRAESALRVAAVKALKVRKIHLAHARAEAREVDVERTELYGSEREREHAAAKPGSK